MMHLIKVNAINSTNTMARDLFRKDPGMAPTCISAKEQLKGRGQRGTAWISRPGQNLALSIIWPQPNISIRNQFLLSATVSIGIVAFLSKHGIPDLKIKWPNDILAEKYKIGGILIENVIGENALAASIIGIGLNVNQTNFENLPAAGSLKLATGLHFNLEELQEGLLAKLEYRLELLNDYAAAELMPVYKSLLFRFKKVSVFELPQKERFMGIIENISPTGKLMVRNEDDILREFDLKEIKLCY